MRSIVNSILQVAVTILLPLAIVPAVLAQREADRDREANERDLELRSWNLKRLELLASKGENNKPRAEQALAQLQEDFTRIQVVNKNLGRAAIGKAALDLKFVSKSVSEIKKRAERLNVNLKLPEPEAIYELPKSYAVERPEQLKSSVLKLVTLVFRFVDNPFFKEASVVDAKLTAKARSDLESIIEMSEQLKKDSEKFDKTAREKPSLP